MLEPRFAFDQYHKAPSIRSCPFPTSFHLSSLSPSCFLSSCLACTVELTRHFKQIPRTSSQPFRQPLLYPPEGTKATRCSKFDLSSKFPGFWVPSKVPIKVNNHHLLRVPCG